jgi:hypothetical protein
MWLIGRLWSRDLSEEVVMEGEDCMMNEAEKKLSMEWYFGALIDINSFF